MYLIKQHGISPKLGPDVVSRATAGEGESHFNVHLRRMAGYGLLILGLVLVLSLLVPAPLGQPGVAGAEVTKPWWVFVWLFPAEASLGARALLVVPAVLGVLLALVPLLDRSPYMSPARRKWLLIIAGLILVAILASGVAAELSPVTRHLE